MIHLQQQKEQDKEQDTLRPRLLIAFETQSEMRSASIRMVYDEDLVSIGHSVLLWPVATTSESSETNVPFMFNLDIRLAAVRTGKFAVAQTESYSSLRLKRRISDVMTARTSRTHPNSPVAISVFSWRALKCLPLVGR